MNNGKTEATTLSHSSSVPPNPIDLCKVFRRGNCREGHRSDLEKPSQLGMDECASVLKPLFQSVYLPKLVLRSDSRSMLPDQRFKG